MTRRVLGPLAAAAAVIAMAGCGGSAASSDQPPDRYRGSEPPAEMALPHFVLEDQAGEVLDSNTLLGKVVILTFLDSHCTSSCPVIAFQIARTLDTLDSGVRGRVEAIAISTDPVADTPATIRSFLRKQRAAGRLRFLDGKLGQLEPLWKRFRILSSHESGRHTLHSAPVRIYNPSSEWVSTLHPGADLNVANLAHDIRVALAGDQAAN